MFAGREKSVSNFICNLSCLQNAGGRGIKSGNARLMSFDGVEEIKAKTFS